MSNLAPSHASTAATNSPFPRARLILISVEEKIQVGDMFVHISSDVRCMYASSNPQLTDDFAASDVVIDLKRSAESDDGSDQETAPANEILPPDALADSVRDVAGPRSDFDNCTLSVSGNVTVRPQRQARDSQGRASSAARGGVAWLVAGSREERDVLLLLLRARVAPTRVWFGVCRGHVLKCESRSSVRLRSFCEERASQASHRELVDALVSERSRWMRDHIDASEALARSYGEGSKDDVSDATLLLYASLMQMVALSARVGAAASRDELCGARAAISALQSIDTYSRRVSEAVHGVLSAAVTTVRDSSMSEVAKELIECWDTLMGVEETLRKIVSQGATNDATQESLQDSEADVQGFSQRASYAEQRVALHERVTMQRNGGSPSRRDNMQDTTHETPFSVDIPHSLAVTKEGSPRFERVVDKILNKSANHGLQTVAVTSVSGEGGAGKTSVCVLALGDPRVKCKYKDGVIGFEVGLDAQEKDVVKKIANVVEDCQGVSAAQSIRSLTKVGEAAKEARRFFRNRKILLYLDNVWPDNRFLENLISIANGPGSCVLFSTRSAALAQGYTEQVVDLGTLRLDVPEERASAAAIFFKHLGPQRGHRWCTEANVNEALSLSQGLPIAIATLAALVRNKLVCRVTINLLGQVAGNLRSPPMGSAQNVVHMGLFAAMRESLEFLDRQHSATNGVASGSQGLMTRRYASLHALDRSENCIDASVLSIVWDTSLEVAEATAGEFFNLGLVTLAQRGAVSSGYDNESLGSDTLTLHDLQVEYSAHVAHNDQHGISTEEVHETAVRGMFEGDVDIDSLTATDFVGRCENLCQTGRAGEDNRGRYVVSNLVRYLVGSLTPKNASRRWPTIRGLLSDARWLMLWQGVDGWLYVCNRYAALRDMLSSKEGVLQVVRDAEIGAIVEVGHVAPTIPVASRSQQGEVEVKTAAVEMYFRLHATWWDRTEGVSPTVLQHALESLCVVASQWWMRPMVACRRARILDRRLRRMFAASRNIVSGCALIGTNGHVVTSSEDGVVRVHDGVGTVVAQHQKHSKHVSGLCVGRPHRDTEYRVLSVSDDRTLVRWDVSLPTAIGGMATAVEPVVVASTETKLIAVACSDDASVVAAGDMDGAVYVWALGGDESRPTDASKFEAREHTDWVRCVAVSSDGATVLSCSDDGTSRVWAVADALRGGAPLCWRAVLGGRYQERDMVLSCAFARADRVAVTAHAFCAVRFWSLADATLLGEVDLRSGEVRSLAAIGRDGDEVVAGTARGTAHVVRVSDRAVTAQLGREDGDQVRSVSTSRDDMHTVVCGHRSGQVKVWDARRSSDGGATDVGTRTCPQRPHHSDRVYTVSTSSCQRFVVSGSRDWTVRCWRADTGRELWTRDCGSRVYCVCVSADGAHVACGCNDGTVRVLGMANGEVVCEWKHQKTVYSVCMHKLSDDLVWSGHSNGDVVAWSRGRRTPAHHTQVLYKVLAWSRGTNMPAHRVRGLHKRRVRALGVAAGGKCVYSQDHRGCTARIEISDNGETSTTIVDDSPDDTTGPDRGNAFAEHTAQGFRTGGGCRRHSRVRHTHGDTVHELAATAVRTTGLNIDLRLPDGTEAAITPTFESIIYAVDASFVADVDASFVAAADGSCSFAQVAYGLEDGSVCILRQPLAEDNQHWHPAESLQ